MKVSKNLILVLLVSFVLMFNTMVMAGGGGGSEVPSPNQVANMKIDYLTSSNSWDISGWDGYYDKRRSYSYEPYCDNFPSSDRSNYKCDLYRIYYKDFYVSEKSDFKIEYDFKESEWMDRFHQTVFSSLKKIESDGSLMENESGTKSWIDNDYYEHDYNDYRIDQGDQAYRIDELASGWYRLEMGVVLESDGWENYDSITSDQPGATGAEYYGYDSKNPFPIMSRGCGTKIITIGEKYTGWPTMNIEDASPDRTYCGKSKSYWVSELNDLSPRHYLDEKAVFYYIPGYAEFSSIKIEWYNNTSNPPENPGANQPPSINVSNKSVNENNTLTVNLNGYSSDPDGDSLSFSKVSGPGYMSGDYYKMNTNYYGANDAGSYSVKVKVSDGKGGVDYDWFTVTVNNVWREKDLYEPNPPTYDSYPSLPPHPGPRTTFPSAPTEPAKPYEPLEYDPDTEWTDCTPTTCPDTDDYIDPLSEPENPTNNAKLKTFLADVESSNIEISDIIEGDEGYQQFTDSVDEYEYLMGVLDKVQEVNKQNYEEYNQKAEDYNDEVKSLWNTYETNYNQAESDYNTWLNERQDYLDTVNQIQNIKADNESKKDSYFNGPYDDFYNNTVPYYEARYDNVVIHEKSGKYPPTAPSYSSVDSPYVSKPDYVSRPELLDPKYPGDYVIGNE